MRLAILAGLAACGRLEFGRVEPVDGAPDGTPDARPDAGLPAGLIHYWPLDEAPGATMASDVVGGANATLSGTATFVAGHRGDALYSGAGGFATIAATPADMLGRSQLTISAWFLRSAVSGVEQFGQELSPGSDTISLQLWTDGATYFCVGTPGACGTTPAANDTSWHFMVMVFDGTQATDSAKLVGYVDGVAQTLSWAYTTPVATMTPTVVGSFDLGATGDNEGDDTGTIDDVRVYDRALAPDEVQVLFAGT